MGYCLLTIVRTIPTNRLSNLIVNCSMNFVKMIVKKKMTMTVHQVLAVSGQSFHRAVVCLQVDRTEIVHLDLLDMCFGLDLAVHIALGLADYIVLDFVDCTGLGSVDCTGLGSMDCIAPD